MTERISTTLTINGRQFEIEIEPRRLLADAIREDCGLTGTHLGCEHGVCGACTIVLDGEPVRSCLMLAVQAAGASIETVEGLSDGTILHPLQREFIENHSLQCGFCTPGFLMLTAGVLEKDPFISDDDLMDALSSNLCRCTGYHNIKAAVRKAAAEIRRRHTRESDADDIGHSQ